MKWSEVNYVLNGVTCTVLFDSHKEPGVVRRFTGKIQCAGPDVLQVLRNLHTPSVMNVPYYAEVILHTPDNLGQNTAWRNWNPHGDL